VAAAWAILRVTTNRGASTPGVDGITWTRRRRKLLPSTRCGSGATRPNRYRVYIPKSNGPETPFRYPHHARPDPQALYLPGLDPLVETQADYNSYGFRLHRSCADALVQCHRLLCKRTVRTGCSKGDIRACYDRISRPWLLKHIPMTVGFFNQWLTAGYLEKRVFHATTDGTPQGGIISPALANGRWMVLEGCSSKHFGATRSARARNGVHLVRYADVFIITGTSKALLRDECNLSWHTSGRAGSRTLPRETTSRTLRTASTS